MVFSLTWLPDVLDRANLKFSEVAEWRTRGRAEMGIVRGIIVHHTAGSANGNMPSLDLLIKGRPNLSGPLAQLGLGRDGTFYIIAAGRANHAGPGKWRGIATGNSSFIGIEVENTGKPDDPYPEVQMDALHRGVAAILQQIGADSAMVCGHKEYAPNRKIDPLWAMAPFREAVAALIQSGVPPAPAIPASDENARPTLRRGARGPIVTLMQGFLGISPATGNFGPVTEARLRAWQRDHGLVPDGISGPKTWASLVQGGEGAVTLVPTPSEISAVGVAIISQPDVNGSPAGFPPADDAANPVTSDARSAFFPQGTPFATRIKLGFRNLGQTGVDDYLAADPDAGAGLSVPTLRVIIAVMGNEGKLESINSYDNAFMSFGIMQWTAGATDGEGELGALLARLEVLDSPTFNECFGRFGLGAVAGPGAMYGRLTLDGQPLTTSRDKAVLRTPDWAYRFWRAGHHPAVRHCQIVHAAGRIALFADKVIAGHRLRDWLSSELGMALLLDQHVNRPGHVPATLNQALDAVLAVNAVPADPSAWSDADEACLIDRYVSERAKTTMTHTGDRAAHMFNLAHTGKLSMARGSFQ